MEIAKAKLCRAGGKECSCNEVQRKKQNDEGEAMITVVRWINKYMI
jgi:hypothetical protein